MPHHAWNMQIEEGSNLEGFQSCRVTTALVVQIHIRSSKVSHDDVTDKSSKSPVHALALSPRSTHSYCTITDSP
jgi:hypothetical protein